MAKSISMAAQLHNIPNSSLSGRRPSASPAVRTAVSGAHFMFPATTTWSSTKRSLMVVLASKSQNDVPDSVSQEEKDDLKYVLKLGGGSVLGAGAIKYGSVLFPEITRPNIFQALFMISAPVIISVFLLIKKSSAE